MKIIRTALIALAITTAAPAYAGDLIDDLAVVTGLSERQVKMIVSNRTPYAEYRINYDRSLAQFKRVLGKERAEQLIAGDVVLLERRIDARVVAVEPRRENPRP